VENFDTGIVGSHIIGVGWLAMVVIVSSVRDYLADYRMFICCRETCRERREMMVEQSDIENEVHGELLLYELHNILNHMVAIGYESGKLDDSIEELSSRATQEIRANLQKILSVCFDEFERMTLDELKNKDRRSWWQKLW